MANVFEYLNYRGLIKDRAAEWKKRRGGWTLSRLAEKAGVHPPYLTNVLKDRAHLNSDQLYLVAKALGLGSDETSYALLLLEWERSSCSERKRELENEIATTRKRKLKSEAHINAPKVELARDEFMRYYLSPELQLVYAFLGVPKYAKNFNAIAASLGVEAARIEECVRELSDLGFIKIEKENVVKSFPKLHLPKDSPLAHAQQQVMRLRALQHQQLLPENDKYSFMVTFTADEATREKIQREFLKLLGSIESYVKDAPSEAVYQMSFDLFPWSKRT